MKETASILQNATSRSFVVMDEVGRGTSTQEGLALACAVIQHLHDEIGCRTLFASHFHELYKMLRPVGDKNIESPSVRFLENLAYYKTEVRTIIPITSTSFRAVCRTDHTGLRLQRLLVCRQRLLNWQRTFWGHTLKIRRNERMERAVSCCVMWTVCLHELMLVLRNKQPECSLSQRVLNTF
ncbi:muts domain V-domain-containing protein [Cladochytrium replicatum]|nr:muts domain V-domain-containing protein [Cladochytrium replicatum]